MFDIDSFYFSWRNLLDIALVTICLYYLFRFVRGTRAVAALQGVLFLFVIYLIAWRLNLYTLAWLLENFFGSLFLVLVILFSDDIRKGLSRMNFKHVFRRKLNVDNVLVEDLVGVCAELAKKKIGAIIVLELNVPLGDYVQRGVRIDAQFSRDLISTIFFPNTALHDGAVIINREGRIVAAGCVLPLTQMLERQNYGTRHRAAIGLTEVSDACVLVVSEERGAVTIAHEGHLSNPLNPERLERVLTNVLS